MNKINSIQFLRAIAALLVAYNHSIQLQMEFSKSAQQNFYHLWNFGCIGVDIFFVVSGFIICYANEKYSGAAQGTNFLIKRFIRINPAYYIASLIFLIVLITDIWVIKGINSLSLNTALNCLSDTILVIPASSTLDEFKPILVAGWTLGFEWLFYLLFFLLIVCRAKNKTMWLFAIILILVSLGQLFRFADYRFIFSTNSILLEFLLGIGIYNWYKKSKTVPIYVPTILLSIGIISFACLLIYGFDYVWSYIMVLTNKLSLKRVVLFGIPSAAIVAGCLFLEKRLKLQWLWNSKLTNKLGDASYSLYLINPIVFALISLLYKKVGFFMPPDLSIVIQFIIAVIISIVFFITIERPFINMGKSIRMNKKQFKPVAKNIVST